jgi:tRNA-dihydrouridine synthase B
MRIGPYELSSNLFLSPLAGYTNLPFRVTVRELGGVGWATTDLVNARSLLEKQPHRPEAGRVLAGRPPLAIQLFGSVPEEMRDAAVICEEMGASVRGHQHGLPGEEGRQDRRRLRDDDRARQDRGVVRGMIEAVKIPVTAKMRLGWDDDNLTAPDLARVLEDVASPPSSCTVARAPRASAARSTSPASAPWCRR